MEQPALAGERGGWVGAVKQSDSKVKSKMMVNDDEMMMSMMEMADMTKAKRLMDGDDAEQMTME